MKKIFFCIGMLLSIYSIYIMFLVADKQLYLNNNPYYDITLEEAVTLSQLEEYASDYNLALQVREYLSVGFGNFELNLYVLNANVQSSNKNSIVPGQKIHVMTDLTPEKRETKVQTFMVQTKEKEKVESLLEALEEDHHDIELVDEGNPTLQLSQLFSSLNLKFYLLMFVLILFTTIIYYLTRGKEIGVRKLHGWKEIQISVLIHRRIAGWSLLGIAPLSGIFLVYICVRDKTVLGQYLFMLAALLILLLAVYAAAALVSGFFMKGIGCISAIKESKNEKLLVIILTMTKIMATVLFCMIFSTAYSMILDVKDMVEEAEKIKAMDYYMVWTYEALSEKEMQEIDDYLHQIKDEDVYHYVSSDLIYSKSGLKNKKRISDYESCCDNNMVLCSYNLLENLELQFMNPDALRGLDVSKNTLLIPQYLESEKNEILSYLELPEDMQVIDMTDDQSVMDLLNPGKYAYNPIILVTPSEKGLYMNMGERLYKKDTAEKIEKFLTEQDYGKSRITVQSLDMELDEFLSTAYVELVENILWAVIVVIAFCLTSYALLVSIIQSKKKMIAVYRLNGKNVLLVVAGYLLCIMAIDVVVSAFWMWQLVGIMILEVILCAVELHQLLKNGAARVLKGE